MEINFINKIIIKKSNSNFYLNMIQFIKNYKIAWIAISVLLIFGSALTMACGFSGSFAISVLISGVIAPVIFVTSGLAAIYFYILLKETEE